jgi:RHS repeat-associated protein
MLDPNLKQPFAYTGREYDEETGLYYYRARYYDADTGRFISEDPIGFEGGDVNLYVYVGNNPVLLIDPEGYSGRSVLLGTTSAALNTAALATIWNPIASGYIKTAGIIISAATVANAIYEYKTGQISGTVLAITSGTEVANVLGGFAAKPVEAMVTGLTRGVGIANTSVDAVKTFAPSPQPTRSATQNVSGVCGK